MTVAGRPKPGPCSPSGASAQSTTPSSASIDPPGVGLDQVARPQRREDRDDQQPPGPRRGDLGHEERHRQGEHHVDHRHRDARRRACAARPCGRRRLGEQRRGSCRASTLCTTSPVKASVRPERREQQRPRASRGRRRPATAAARPAAAPSRSRGCRCRTPAAPPRPCATRCRPATVVDAQPLISGPGLRPVAVVLAGHVGAPVEALRGRRGPVPDLVEVRPRRRRGTSCRSSCPRSPRRPCCWPAPHRTTRPPAAFTFGRDDPVHPHVGAVRVLGLRRDHPGVRPAGRALARQDRLDRRLVGLGEVGDDLPGGADHRVAGLERLDLLGVVATSTRRCSRSASLSRATAASNCLSSSAYGFLMPSSGLVFIRYSAASAM